MAHLTDNHANEQRWIMIYPNYINSKRTVKYGRRIPLSKGDFLKSARCQFPQENKTLKAVDNPRVNEMKDVLQHYEFNHIIEEHKQYPKDSAKDALCKGRVRVQIKDENGQPLKPEYPTRKSVMLLLGEMIPKLKSRQSKGASGEGGSVSSSSKKKDKKKK